MNSMRAFWRPEIQHHRELGFARIGGPNTEEHRVNQCRSEGKHSINPVPQAVEVAVIRVRVLVLSDCTIRCACNMKSSSSMKRNRKVQAAGSPVLCVCCVYTSHIDWRQDQESCIWLEPAKANPYHISLSMPSMHSAVLTCCSCPACTAHSTALQHPHGIAVPGKHSAVSQCSA